MTCTQGKIIFAFIALITLGTILRYHVIFNSYCARIAKLEGRQKDFQSLQSLDGGGMNFFEIEQASKIFRREYLKFNDEQVNGLATKLFRSGFVGLAAMIAAALWWAYLKVGICSIS